jgi:apolipoprotein D and lipocalin family protein
MRTMLFLAGLLLAGCATTERRELPPLTTVDRVEVNRSLGTWYEIASFPQRFQKSRTATTANDTLRDDGVIRVVNRCRKDALDGPEDEAQAWRAWWTPRRTRSSR